MNKRIIAGAAAAAITLFCCGVIYGSEAIQAHADASLKFSLATPAPVELSSGNATTGSESVTVDIQLDSNPGAQSWVLLLDYDKDKLIFDSVTPNAAFKGIITYDKGGQIVINDFENADVTSTGTAVSVKFKLKAGVAKGSYSSFSLAASSDPGNFFNYKGDGLTPEVSVPTAFLTIKGANDTTGANILSNVKAKNAPAGTSFDISILSGSNTIASVKGSKAGDTVGSNIPNGTYTVIISCSDKKYAAKTTTVTVNNADITLSDELYIYGDVDKSGVVTLSDLGILQQYLADWDISFPYIEVANVDGSADNAVNFNDLGRLQQYLCDWDVTIGRS